MEGGRGVANRESPPKGEMKGMHEYVCAYIYVCVCVHECGRVHVHTPAYSHHKGQSSCRLMLQGGGTRQPSTCWEVGDPPGARPGMYLGPGSPSRVVPQMKPSHLSGLASCYSPHHLLKIWGTYHYAPISTSQTISKHSSGLSPEHPPHLHSSPHCFGRKQPSLAGLPHLVTSMSSPLLIRPISPAHSSPPDALTGLARSFLTHF